MLERLKKFADEDPILAGSLVDLFLEQAPEFLEQIETAIEQKDGKETKKAVHTFKGVCLNLGFDNLGSLCQQMEAPALSQDFEKVSNILKKLENDYDMLKGNLNAFQAALSAEVTI